ncbi:MAG: PAS domain S-box protein [Candidatus Lokiarchaeota archaeon]|nr:PAS domain S-box protein [Candidatus Lokiarchaeota archaeon]
MDDLSFLKNNINDSKDGYLPKYMVLKWQNIVNLLAKLVSVPVALIKKLDPPYIEIICSSESQMNPYKSGDRAKLAGQYCEEVMKQNSKLLISNAIKEKDWEKNPDIKLKLISYLGYPLLYPDGSIFGTISVLDVKKNDYSTNFENLILQFKELIESHLLQLEFDNKFGESEQNYRNIVEQSLMGIVIIQDDIIKYTNQKMADMLEYSKDEVLNWEPNEFYKAVCPESLEYAKDQIPKRQLGLSNTKEHNIIKMRKKSGDTYWADSFSKSIKYQGRPASLSLQIDITERKNIEEEVNLHKQRLESLLTLSQLQNVSEKEVIRFALEESVKLTKSEVGYLHFFNDNQKSIDLFIWSNNVMKECYSEDNSHYSLDKAGIWADCIRLRKPVIHNDYQNNLNKKGYPEGHFSVKRHMSVPIFEAGKIIAIIGVGNKNLPYNETDTHQLILYMDNMWRILNQKRSEKKYQVLFYGAPDGILITDQNLKIIDSNPALDDLIGYKKKEIIGKTIFELPIYEQDTLDFIKKLYNENSIEDHPDFIEYEIINKNGKKIWIEIQISEIKKGEKVIYQSIIRNISVRKEIEEKLKKSEENYRKAYEQINFYKDLFSHDISNFIQVINNASSLFPYVKQESNTMNETINRIQKNSRNAIRLIENVRKLSNIEDNIGITFTEIDILNYLNEAIQQIKENFFQNKLNIEIITSLKSIKIHANEFLLDLFENLLNNAVKYNDNKIIEITIKISDQQKNNQRFFLMEFIDNGIGIADNKKELIFQKGNRTIKGGKGMGIGLSLVKTLVELFGGKIWIKNRIKKDYSKGSNFLILLPKIS